MSTSPGWLMANATARAGRALRPWVRVLPSRIVGVTEFPWTAGRGGCSRCSGRRARQARQELGSTLKMSSDSLQQRLADNIRVQKGQLDSFSKQLMALARLNEEKLSIGINNRIEIRIRNRASATRVIALPRLFPIAVQSARASW